MKCDSDFFTKCDKSYLHNAPRFLLQNTTFFTKCVGTYIKRKNILLQLIQISLLVRLTFDSLGINRHHHQLQAH